jgi:hypothetical protein
VMLVSGGGADHVVPDFASLDRPPERRRAAES